MQEMGCTSSKKPPTRVSSPLRLVASGGRTRRPPIDGAAPAFRPSGTFPSHAKRARIGVDGRGAWHEAGVRAARGRGILRQMTKTSAPSGTSCLLCQQVVRAERFAGGPLIADDSVVVYHIPPNERFPRQYLGRVQVVTRRHVDHLADLTEEETTAAALAARRIAQALRAMEGVDRVHLALIGQHHPHFHLHVYPRYTWMPLDADWNALSARTDAPCGGEPEIIDYINRLRPLIPSAPA